MVLIMSLSFYFANKDSGARCWGKKRLTQRDGESTQLFPPLPSFPERELMKQKILQPDHTLLFFLCISLPNLPTFPHSLWSLPVNLLLALPLDLQLILLK